MNNEGWICPKCGRVYSPTTPMCFYCNNEPTTYKVEWTNKDALSQEEEK